MPTSYEIVVDIAGNPAACSFLHVNDSLTVKCVPDPPSIKNVEWTTEATNITLACANNMAMIHATRASTQIDDVAIQVIIRDGTNTMVEL